MPPDPNQPQAAAAITDTNPTLPVADGALETSVGVSDEVDFDTWEDDGPFAAFDFEELVEKAPEHKISDKRAQLQQKLTAKLNLRKGWDGFVSLSEEIMFIAFKDVKEDQQIADTTYEAIIDHVKKMEKKIDTRSKEFKTRAESLKKLQNSILKLDPTQHEAHLDELCKARLLIQKVETQQEMDKFEDPIVLSSELDSVRKQIQTTRVLPFKNFASTPIEDIIFNVERNDFASFIGQLRNRFHDNDQFEKLQNSFLLPLQTVFEQPQKWFRIHLLGIGTDRIFAYVRGDNGYFSAWGTYKNKVIFELGRLGESRLFPDSVFVDCDGSYPSMMNFERSTSKLSKAELKKRMKALKLSRKNLLKDIHILSNYNPLEPGDVKRFQQALARIAVMICEVCRIIQLFLDVVNGWVSGTYLDDLLLEYIWRWKLLSRAFLKWRTNDTIKLSEKLKKLVKLEYGREVGSVYNLVLNYKRGKDERYGDQLSDDSDDDQDQDDQEQDEQGQDDQEQIDQGQDDQDNDIQPGDAAGCDGDETKIQPGGGEKNKTKDQHGDTSRNEDATSNSSVSRSTQRNYISFTSRSASHHKRQKRQKIQKMQYKRTGMVTYPLSAAYYKAQRTRNIRMEAPVISAPSGLLDVFSDLDKPMTVCTRLSSASSLTRPGIVPTPHSHPFSVLENYIGQALFEIFEVSATFPFYGTIFVCDQHSSKVICQRDSWRQSNSDFSSGRDKWVLSGNAAVHYKDKIELTGPSCATTADSGFDIAVCMPGTRRKPCEIRKLSFNCDEPKLYNKLKTYTMKTDRGCIYVTCSVLDDALDTFLDVKLQVPSQWMHDKSAEIYGCITARMAKFEVGSTLFDRDANEAVPLALPLQGGFTNSPQEGYTVVRVPLRRSNLALSLEEDIHLKGTLHVCGYDSIPINIEHCFNPWSDDIEVPWKRNGETFSCVRMSRGPIF